MSTIEPWRRDIGKILWNSMFAQLDDAFVGTAADAVLRGAIGGVGPESYVASIEAALATDRKLSTAFESPHSEREFRDFLRRLRDELAGRRPWPVPPYVKRPVAEWALFAGGRAVARLRGTPHDVAQRLHVLFDDLPDAGPTAKGLVLHLRSGHDIALVNSGAERDRNTTLVLRDSDDGDGAVTAFQELAGFPPDRMKRVE